MDKTSNFAAKGQGMVEYALLLILIALFLVGSLTLLSSTMGNVFIENLFPILNLP
ncbi:MAG: hypothetical protein KIS85_02805 [Anaerolineales bacterium]|nr:hypothetical protein [Anaerolineales bacterium]